jgi:4-hydroxybenzoate polyprenyltransferase
VNARKTVERRAEESCRVERAFPRRHSQWRDLFSALRPQQWVKNALVFVPLFTAFQFQDRGALLGALIAFVAFCACASATYVLNDLLDLEADRAHPRKRQRAFASGRVSIRTGLGLAAVLMSAGIVVAGAHSPSLLLILVGYMLATTAYSLRLKHYALLDGIILASLYTSRVAAGVVATDINPSPWLIAFALFVFCSLALLKRCAELVMLESNGATVTQRRDYRVADLRVLWPFGIALSTCSLVVFVLYVNAPEVRERYASPDLLWLAALGLAYWLGRMWLKTSRGEMTDDPIVYSLRDIGSRVTVGFIVLTTLLAHIVTIR